MAHRWSGILVALSAAYAGSMAWAASAAGAASLPGPPPVSASAFPLELAGSQPVDNDGRIPAPSTPAVPECTTTITAPASGSVAAIQSRIDADVAKGNSFTGDTICLRGVFRQPLHVRGKFSAARLTIASAPGTTATFNLISRPPRASDEDPNATDSTDVGAIEIGDSRDVELYGLLVENWITTSTSFVPAGIYVTVRSDAGGAVSPCYTHSHDHVCGDIFLFHNTVARVENNAAGCGSANINAFGIAVKSFGQDAAHALQHVVLEGNTVTHTATGESETVTVNGDLVDFLVAGNTISDVNNIGLDLIGWETGGTAVPGAHNASQARNGLVSGNSISNVDTTTNLNGYGILHNGKCVPGDDQAGGLYVDGGAYLWLDHNTLNETNHGIELGVEHGGRTADHLLVTSNTVTDGRGATFSGKSYAGHAAEAFIVGGVPQEGPPTSLVTDVYAHDNKFTNRSQFYNDGTPNPKKGKTAPVVNVTGGWQSLWMLHNTITGLGASDTLNPLLVVDNAATGRPRVPPGVVVDCNRYDDLSSNPDPSSADNFDTPPGNSFGLFTDYRDQNKLPTSEHGVTGWDANGRANATPSCPFTLPHGGA